jgi:hypothetical protein
LSHKADFRFPEDFLCSADRPFYEMGVIYKSMQDEEPEEEETAEERSRRWITRESAKADSRVVRCAKCGKEVKEFADRAGRILCMDCYLEEEIAEGGSLDMPEIGGGAG